MPDDEEPIVLLDDAELDALMSGPSAENLLTELATRSALALGSNSTAQDLLRSAGITDPAVWAAYRLGAGGDAIAQGLSKAELVHCITLGLRTKGRGFVLAGAGVNIPTYDPHEPEHVVGFIRLLPAQLKHHFTTPPVGLACATTITSAEMIILADGPLIGLRLAQAGVPHVAIVADPQVLPPLVSWLAKRKVLIASSRHQRMQILLEALGDIGPRSTQVLVNSDIGGSSAASLKLLGLSRKAIRPPKVVVELAPVMLRDLYRYARDRVEAGEGNVALRTLEADVPDLVKVYQLGFLPSGFGKALPTDVRAAIHGHKLGGCIVAPALDEHGTIVDLWIIRADKGGNVRNFFPEPRGLLGGNVGTAYADVIVTDYLRGLGRLFRDGHRNVLMLRSPADATLNAYRLRASGVTSAELRVSRDSVDIAKSLQAVGIVVRYFGRKRTAASRQPLPVVMGTDAAPTVPDALTPSSESVSISESIPSIPVRGEPEPLRSTPAPKAIPASVTIPVEPLELVQHDRQAELATFKAGLSVYVVEVPWDTEAKLEVTLRHAVSPLHRDRFDLASAAARNRFASAAPLRCGLPSQVVEVHLLGLLDGVRALQRQADPLAQPRRVEVLGAERDEAMALLMDPNLLDRLMADLDALGWAGEADTKQALYLAAISRMLPEPLWAVRLATQGSGKSFGIQTIADLTPPEDLIQVTLLTGRALYHQDEQALRHKLLVIDESDALSLENITALRTLKTRGALSMRQALPAGTGQRSRQVDAQGPVALLTSTAGRLDDQLQSRCLLVPVDESPAQTIRIVSAQSRIAANPRAASTSSSRDAIIQRHRNFQRLLAHREVAIPFAERIDFPTSSVRHRRGFLQFLGLIRASALLHQHQRQTDHGQVAADERDFAIAARLAETMGIADEVEMGRGARQLLTAVQAARPASFTIADARGFLPLGTAYAVRKAVTELEQLGLVEGPAGGRGTTGTYRLSPSAVAGPRRIRLGEVGEVREPLRQLTTPVQNVG